MRGFERNQKICRYAESFTKLDDLPGGERGNKNYIAFHIKTSDAQMSEVGGKEGTDI